MVYLHFATAIQNPFASMPVGSFSRPCLNDDPFDVPVYYRLKIFDTAIAMSLKPLLVSFIKQSSVPNDVSMLLGTATRKFFRYFNVFIGSIIVQLGLCLLTGHSLRLRSGVGVSKILTAAPTPTPVNTTDTDRLQPRSPLWLRSPGHSPNWSTLRKLASC